MKSVFSQVAITLSKAIALATLSCVGGIFCAGCGSAPSDTVPVHGTATFDGQPIAKGSIVLIPVDGKTASDGGAIVDGKFDLRAKPGKKRVEIHASREGKFDPVMGQAEQVGYIPAKYNTQSTLSAEIKVDGENKLEFVLTTGP
jgi:hypothetical protein